jgi:hypothetical protein
MLRSQSHACGGQTGRGLSINTAAADHRCFPAATVEPALAFYGRLPPVRYPV